ncbi:ER-golgi trafficking TRAPP I complex subunit [Nitzschia inconspicua]|uniref:ER-golgi trafficking TRAPP I complex subunit n=1 Tax=Nitzschia inconspicua TaxID=303405 RepID=A0A9K3PKD6_9STRA|nr:ER-golgi trafficking TRAPP I complex subunit [Nitzschia inconspicua]
MSKPIKLKSQGGGGGNDRRQRPNLSDVPVHESTATLPPLDSAPPSLNFPMMASADHPLSTLPPPPPPPRLGTSQQVPLASTPYSATNSMSPPTTASMLPPPPTVSPMPVNAMSNASVGMTADLSFPLPPPPPPPPPLRVTATTPGAASQPPFVSPPPPPTPELTDMVVTSHHSSQPVLSPPPFLPLTTFVSGKRSSILAQRQSHIPILVIATEAANHMAWKNSLQLVDLFQGIVHELKLQQNNMTPFRSINRSLFPNEVKVRFVEPSQMEPLSYQAAHDLLNDNAKIQSADGNVAQDLVVLEDRVDELLQERNKEETLQAATKDAYQLTSPMDIPWMVRYRLALDASTNALPHDLINAPPLVLLVCTTNEIEPPDQVLQELYNSPHVLPEAFKNGLYDPQGMRHEVLVLHDAVQGPSNVDDNRLRQSLQRQFGPNAAVLRINSVMAETASALADQEERDLWGGNGQLGNYLSVNDRVLLRRYFQSILTTSLLPAMERRISDLNAIVSERKKGVRNLVKSFWRKPKEENPTTNSSGHGGGSNVGGEGEDTVKYRYDSIESQTRLLADSLFLMQDYDAALSMYRLIRDDYKSDKALVYYASVQEMIALCIYQTDPYIRAKETFSNLETALLSYTRAAEEERSRMNNDSSVRPTAAPSSTRLATRLCLIMAVASDSLTRNREVEVADLLASASSHESNLGAAVLLEQSSAFYHEAKMYRKYAFHILMSGHMFRTAGQDHHAFRCFTSALYVYRNGGWHELHNHLRSALAAQLFSMGRMSVALILYAKLIGTGSRGKVSAKSQQKFLQHLVEICEDHKKAALAGADRMASPSNLPSHERESFRNAQLEKIVNIIKYNVTASRVLELPYVDLPRIQDSSVRIWTHAEQHFVGTSVTENAHESSVEGNTQDELGKPAKGDDSIWHDLELAATAELRAVDSAKPQLDETITAALSKITDRQHRKMIAEIDKEKQNRALIERSKRSGNRKPSPKVRARAEPIFCDFVMTNPLEVDVRITQVQLVVKMTDSQGCICTNQFAIEMKDSSSAGSQQSWSFASTDKLQFTVPEYCRISKPGTRVCQSASSNPFFVVTKHEINLPPGGETTVSLGLTPLVEGDLEILGVRSMLLDKVWVYHPFDVPGPLLRDTRSNIMNRVRGESLLLKAKVEQDMPCLSAELVQWAKGEMPSSVSDGGPLLEGQLSSWRIRLRNVGTAPATCVSLKTNLPWVQIIDENKELSTEEKETIATSHCIGPSGTMMKLPLSNYSDVLQPGEEVDIPIRIRTSGFRKQTFYMLYRYELYDPHQEKLRSRWLRKMYEVPVYPSLLLSAKTLTASLKGKDVLLSVELTNVRTDRPTDLFVTLDHLGLASRHYRLEAFPGQFATRNEFGDVLQIGWQERVTVLYKVVEVDTPEKTSRLSECAFSSTCECSTKLCIDSDAMGYLCLEQAFESFETSWKNHQLELFRLENTPESEKDHPRSIASIRRANTSDVNEGDPDFNTAECHPTSIASLFPTRLGASAVHLVCSWRAILGQEVVRGEHHLRSMRIRPLKSFHGCPVSAIASHPASVTNDFSNGPTYVPVKVTLRNRLLESPVNFLYFLDPSSYEFTGLKMQRVELEPDGHIDISFRALISQPGIFDLQSLRLTVRQGNEEVTYQLSQQWLVSVSDSSS